MLGCKASCGASDCSDTTRDTANKDQGHHRTSSTNNAAASAPGARSGRSSPSSPRVCVEDLTPHLRCGLCREPVAGSLVLSCGHLFCGACLCDHLTRTPACPACQMSLRAIPVRCIAIDHVVGALLPSLAPQQQDAFRRRKQRGECAPSIIAKMLWWLEAGAPAPGGAGDPAAAAAAAARMPPAGPPLLQQQLQPQHAQQALLGRAGSGGMPPGASASARIAAASNAAHDAAMAAAMSAAAAAVASAPPPAPFGLPGQLGAGCLGLGGGACGLGGLGVLGGVPPSTLAALGGAAGLLGPGLRDPALQALPDMAAYNAALSAMAMQSAAAGLPGQGAFVGGYPSLGGLLGV